MLEELVEPVEKLKRIHVAIVNQSENAFEFNQRLMETYSRIARRGYPSKCDISKFSRFIFTSINELKLLSQYYPDMTVVVIKGSKNQNHSVLNDSRFSDENSNWHLFSDCSDFQQCFADVCMVISKEMRKYIIGLDGWSSSGKNAIANIVTKSFKGKTIETGKFYRIVAYELGIKKKVTINDPFLLKKFDEVFENFSLDDYPDSPDLRSKSVNDIVSSWSGLESIREKLFWIFMKEIHGSDESVLCVEGRDVTTFLCRSGLSNWFVICSLDERARRRNIQNKLGFKKNRKSLANRDVKDGNRAIHPCHFDEKFAKELNNQGESPTIPACVIINSSAETVLNFHKEIYQQNYELVPENRVKERIR